MIDQLVGSVGEFPRDDLKDLRELEAANIVYLHDLDDAGVFAVDHDTLDGPECEDLRGKWWEVFLTFHEVTLLGLEELEVTVDADGNAATAHEFFGYLKWVHDRVWVDVKSFTKPFNQYLRYLSNIYRMVSSGLEQPQPQPLLNMILSIISWLCTVILVILSLVFCGAEMYDITKHPQYKNPANYLAVSVWCAAILLTIGCAQYLLVTEIIERRWFVSFPTVFLVWSLVGIVMKQTYRTVDYHITHVDYHAIMKGGQKMSNS